MQMLNLRKLSQDKAIIRIKIKTYSLTISIEFRKNIKMIQKSMRKGQVAAKLLTIITLPNQEKQKKQKSNAVVFIIIIYLVIRRLDNRIVKAIMASRYYVVYLDCIRSKTGSFLLHKAEF